MRLTSEELKLLYQQRTARPHQKSAECLTPDELMDSARGILPDSVRDSVADHLTICSDCVLEYRLICSLEGEAGVRIREPVGSTADSTPPRHAAKPRISIRTVLPTSAHRFAAAAVILTLAAGGSLILWRTMKTTSVPSQSIRGGASRAIAVQPPDKAELDESPGQLSWSAVESAEKYQVQIYDYESKPVWESSPTANTSIALPESVRLLFQPGRPLYWRVTSFHGIERDRSDLFQFVIRAKRPLGGK